MNIPPELIHAMQKDNLILFVGAGLSYTLKNKKGEELKDWKNLVHQILLHLERSNFDVDDLVYVSKKGKRAAITLLNLIESDRDLPKKIIIDFLKEFLDLSPDNDLSLHKKIYQLSRKVITTNYDRAFELAEDDLRKNTAYKGRNYELTKHKDTYSPLLFKLHGCYEGADSMVLFPSQYDDLYNNTNKDAEHSLLVLKNIILNKSILFIGCGMGDFQITNLFAEIKRLQGEYNQNHFIITTQTLDSSLTFLKPIYIKEHKEIPQIIDALLIEKHKINNQKPSETLKLEQQLKEVLLQLKEYEQKGVLQEEKIKREALKYFSRGLQFQLNKEYEKSIEEYSEAIELAPNNFKAYNNWGTAIYELAKRNRDPELFKLAFQKYEKAILIKPENDTFFNWGTAIYELAKLNANPKLFELAFQKYEKAIQFKSDDHEAYSNWGTAIYEFANLNNDSRLLEAAIQKYEKAILIKPDYYEAYNNWGLITYELAKLSKDSELFKLAFQKYEQALRLKPNDSDIYNNWGLAISELAHLNNDSKLLNEAIDKYSIAIELGGSTYNLACLYAVRSDKTNALKYLEKSLQDKNIDIPFVIEDEDWASFQNDPEFITLLSKYRS